MIPSNPTQTYKQQTAGINIGLTGGVASVAQAAYGAANRANETQDDRLKALYAAQGAQALFSPGAGQGMGLAPGQTGVDAIKHAANGNAADGVSLRVGIGASSASSTTKTHDEQAYGSRIGSQGNVTIAATGGDLNVIGSQINGHDVALAAANHLNLLSQAEHHSLDNQNKNASGGVGVQIGSDGVGFYAQASAGKGSAHGNGTTHAISTVNADGTLTLISGNDTTLQGAQLTGNQVLAAIGNNLTIRSEQDTDDYASKQQQLGMKGVIGYGGSASVSYNQSKVDSHYQSVTAVSGIAAGSGGFDITVGGNTHLAGGVIASAAEASKNRLDTGSLTYEHLKNEADYSASSIGLNAGYGSGSFSASPALGMPQSGHSSSETKAGMAQGTIIVRDGNADLSGLDRNPTLDDQTLKPIFDAQKVQEQMEMGQLMGQVGMRAAGDLAGKMGWPEGSPERTLLRGLVGVGMAALGGGDVTQAVLGAGANQLVIQKMAEFLESQGYEKGTPEFATMLQLGSAAIGAAVGEGSGAAAALAGTQYNYLTHLQIDAFKQALESCKGQSDCQSVVDKYTALSRQNDEALQQTCVAAPTSGSCQDGVREALNYANTHVSSYTMPAYANLFGLVTDDINQSRGNVLNIIMTNQSAYGAVNTINARADFFGAMYQQTGAPWFGAAEQTSTKDLMGAEFSVGNFITAGGLGDWRNQAGNMIMQNGQSSFANVYQNYQSPSFDMNAWSLQQLNNEQMLLQPVYEQQKNLTQGMIWLGGNINYHINPMNMEERVQFGCIRMVDFGYQGGCQ